MSQPPAGRPGPPPISVWRGDISTCQVDAIVNAANSELRPGSGVCGAIHAAAGPELARECATLGGCPVGQARATAGYLLPARWVIHTVGPIWRGGSRGEAELLASCYRSSLALASRLGARSLAFPAISTGIFGFPPGPAAEIAISEIRRSRPQGVEQVILVAFDEPARELLQHRLETASPELPG